MSVVTVIVLVFLILAGCLGAVAYFTYQRKLRRAKAIERGLKMVPILIHLPPKSSDTDAGNRDVREVMREKTSQAEVLYNLIAGTATEGFKSKFYGQRHIALEVIAINGVVHFFVAVPVVMVSVVTKAVQTAYPGARLEEAEDHNIFNQDGRLAATLGGEMVLRSESAYPIATYAKLERDPMEAMLTTISGLEKMDGVAVQIMLRPANPKWTHRSEALANAKRKGKKNGVGFSAMDLAKAAYKSPTQQREEMRQWSGQHGPDVSQLELGEVEAIEEKTKHPAFEVLIRVIVSTSSVARSQQLLRDIATAFALFETPGMNGFKFMPAIDVQGLVTAFIFRFFPPELRSNILNSVELATLFHFPDSQFTPSTSVERQQSKQVDGPVQLPTTGLLFGHNEFRGVRKEIRLSPEDRRRHTYILGQTGTGKSTMLENLAVQDMLAGNGFAFIDPHGDSAEKLLSMVPKERSEDVVYFNPADTQYPLGLNLFEFTDPSQKDFIVQETINMLYKLYDPGHTGIIGPRYEHWYRNAALTLMSDPGGSTFIEIPKVFTDTDYLKLKFKHLKDPTVIDFWTKEMGQTSDYHKSEMLGWFVSKFGAFQNNEMMRNIIGQVKSAFNIREVMDGKKILIVNLSKGRIGELNSQLLGMIFVIKFQAAAMSRADTPEDQRHDFALYVDEFQNFSTDSFASILSEARKYRLNLIVANQFIGQLSDEIREAVFGNIGTIVAHRMGPEDAEFMVKQFAPAFDVSDLVNIPNYNAVMRLMIGGLPSQPFTLRDSAPISGANAELGMAIKQLSAAKYGHAKAAVEADILDRMSSQPTGSPQPAPAAPGAPGGAGATPAPSAPGAPAGGQPLPPAAGGPGESGLGAASAVGPGNVGAALGPTNGVGAMPAPGATVTPSGGLPLPASGPAPVSEPVAVASGPQPSSGLPFGVAPAVPANVALDPIGSAPAGPAAGPGGVPAAALPGAMAPYVPGGGAAAGGVASMGVGSVPAMVGMATTPPPIGAPPIGVAPNDAAGAMGQPLQANTAGQPMVRPQSIIDEPNLAMEADQMAQTGGFTRMGAPLGSAGPGANTAAPLPSPEPTSLPAPVSMETPPPPIGAPPVDAPPIGAPPVDLPGERTAAGPAVMPMPGAGPAPVVPPSVSAGTLSFRDITGGKQFGAAKAALNADAALPMPARAQPAPQPVGALPDDPYANIEVLGAPPAPVQPFAPAGRPGGGGIALGSGAPLPDDPYANIDVLGDLTPPVGAGAEGSAAPEVPVGPPPPSGQPLPGDPYAGIDILGATPQATAPYVPSSAGRRGDEPSVMAEAAPMMARPPEPVSEPEPAPPTLEAAVSEPLPKHRPASGPREWPQSNRSLQREASPAPAPAPVFGPEPMPEPRPMPEPFSSPAPEPTGFSGPEPTFQSMPEPLEETPVLAAAPPRPAEPMPAVEAPPAFEPEPMAQPEPETPQQPTVDELIHFVDPNAQAVLGRPELPETMPEGGKPSLSGLPEGVQLVGEAPQQSVPSAPIPMPQPSAAVAPPAPVAVAPSGSMAPITPAPVEGSASVGSGPVGQTPAGPATMAGPNVPALAVPLEKMAKTPPPIGAAPVDMGPQAPMPAPAAPVPDAAPKPQLPVEPAEAQIAKAAESAPIPALNASLAEALEEPVVQPAPPAPEKTAEEAAIEKLESVADMLEEHKQVPVSDQGAPKPSVAEAKPVAATEQGAAVGKGPEVERTEIKQGAPKPAEEAKPGTAQPVAAQTAPPTQPKPEMPAESKDVKPKAQLSAAQQIQKAEHEIDDLLSVSLIHPDSVSGGHHRLPEPVAPPREDETGVDLELNADRQQQAPARAADRPVAQHHGLKVIQPLEPIVPPREQFAKELAAMQAAAQAPGGAASPAPGLHPGEAVTPAGAPVPFPPKPPMPPKPVASAPDAVQAKPPAVASRPVAPPPPVPAPAPAPVSAPTSAPAPMETFDELPQAESLAASDVAKARAERQAMQQAGPVSAPATASAPPAPAKAPEAPAKPADKPVEKPAEAKPAEKSEERLLSFRRKRKRLAEKTEAPAEPEKTEEKVEHIESEAEAEHNKPTEAEVEASGLTGKLIMPTGEKPKAEPVQPKTEKPKKLAPGEVYVDEHGNVVIGE